MPELWWPCLAIHMMQSNLVFIGSDKHASMCCLLHCWSTDVVVKRGTSIYSVVSRVCSPDSGMTHYGYIWIRNTSTNGMTHNMNTFQPNSLGTFVLLCHLPCNLCTNPLSTTISFEQTCLPLISTLFDLFIVLLAPY